MSRSHKKTPCINYVTPDTHMKRVFNRSLRSNTGLDFPSGNAYRKVHESWDIHDARFVGPCYETFRDVYLGSGYFETERECRRAYYKWYLAK